MRSHPTEQPSSDNLERLRQVSREYGARLEAEGFGATGRGWSRTESCSVLQAIEIDAHDYGDRIDFTVLWGVEVQGVQEVRSGLPTSRNLSPADCIVNARIGDIAPKKAESVWYSFRLRDRRWGLFASRLRSNEEILGDLVQRTERDLFPLLDRLCSPDAILDYIVSMGDELDKRGIWPFNELLRANTIGALKVVLGHGPAEVEPVLDWIRELGAGKNHFSRRSAEEAAARIESALTDDDR